MIIVEGPDGAGKTTLVKEIVDQFGIAIGERGTKDRDKLWQVTRSDTYKALHNAVDPDSEIQLWDRLFYSEFVYWDLVGRQKPEFNKADRVLIPQLISALQAPLIWCLPPENEVIENTLNEGHQMAGVEENIKKIYQRYRNMLSDRVLIPQQPSIKLMIYDYTGTKLGTTAKTYIFEEIKKYIRVRDLRRNMA